MLSKMRSGPWQRVIGIVGGLGPHAHIELERRLLAAVADAGGDQAYPEWVVSSIPQTPDRTLALLAGGPSPVPWMVRSLKRLDRCGAGFAMIACVTAHAFLDEVRPKVRLPILDLVEVTLREAALRLPGSGRIGVLATTGALRSGIWARTLERVAPRLELVSLLDLPEGESLQEELLMCPVYGPLREGRRLPGGIKSGGAGAAHRATLTAAVSRLAAAGAACVVTGCTEIPIALGRDPVDGIPLLDPLDLAAVTAVRIARGELPLPLLR
jgi:aspartate racemase